MDTHTHIPLHTSLFLLSHSWTSVVGLVTPQPTPHTSPHLPSSLYLPISRSPLYLVSGVSPTPRPVCSPHTNLPQVSTHLPPAQSRSLVPSMIEMEQVLPSPDSGNWMQMRI